MKASLVFDGGDVIIPESMGTPCKDQMQGTAFDQLGECASRICYDSLGLDEQGNRRGRSSAKLHEHILEVANLSVHEHQNFTVRFVGADLRSVALACINRKGVWVEMIDGSPEVTTNLRAVLEWDRHLSSASRIGSSEIIGETLRYFGNELAPQIVRKAGNLIAGARPKTNNLTPDQAWITLYLYGSRGFTHEQVRHRFAMSQRSTRYVDESESSYIEHPLITKYLNDPEVDEYRQNTFREYFDRSTFEDRKTYNLAVLLLENYLIDRGADKQTARKQARGAARGYLGNALASEMLFSAPVSGWKWILKQRASRFADAEIRAIYEQALPALKSSRYAAMFHEFELIDSPDGIGKVLK